MVIYQYLQLYNISRYYLAANKREFIIKLIKYGSNELFLILYQS